MCWGKSCSSLSSRRRVTSSDDNTPSTRRRTLMSKRRILAVAISAARCRLAPAGPRQRTQRRLRRVRPNGTRLDVGSNRDAPIVGANNPNINRSATTTNQPNQLDLIPDDRRRSVRRPVRRRSEPDAASGQLPSNLSVGDRTRSRGLVSSTRDRRRSAGHTVASEQTMTRCNNLFRGGGGRWRLLSAGRPSGRGPVAGTETSSCLGAAAGRVTPVPAPGVTCEAVVRCAGHRPLSKSFSRHLTPFVSYPTSSPTGGFGLGLVNRLLPLS